MNDKSLQLKVGLFVLLGIAVIGLITLFIGQFRLTKGHGYTLYADFTNVAGLNVGGSVRIAGVEVGEVKDITLDGDRARVTMSIFPGVAVYHDADVELRAFGALGDKYVLINPGTSATGAMTNGDTITKTIAESDINDVVKNLSEITATINDVIGNPESKKDLKEIIVNLKDASSNISSITAKLNGGRGTLGKLMNDETVYNDVKSMTEKINKGEGTLGKLVKDGGLYDETQNSVREIRKAAEGIEEQTPISVMATIFGLFF